FRGRGRLGRRVRRLAARARAGIASGEKKQHAGRKQGVAAPRGRVPVSHGSPWSFCSCPRRDEVPEAAQLHGRFIMSIGFILHCRGWCHEFLGHLLRGQRAAEIRSEEHTSELQSRENLVCRLLLEKKKKRKNKNR